MDLGLASENREQVELPAWAQWLIQLGRIVAVCPPEEGLRNHVLVTLPDRRFAALLVGLGAVYAGLERCEPEVEDRFSHLMPGDSYLTWIDANRELRFGKFLGIADGYISYRSRLHGGWSSTLARRPVHKAQGFWPADAADEFVGPRPIADNPAFVDNVLGPAADRFLAADATDALFVAVKAEIDRELDAGLFCSRDEVGSLRDLVRIQGHLGLGQQHRAQLLPASASPESIGVHCEPVAIFDGPHGYLRLRDLVESPVSVVLLDRWNPRSTEASQAAMIDRSESWVDQDAPSLPPTPPGMELFTWTSEL